MNSVPQVEELIKEYLLFRGFSVTFRSFEIECRNDKDKGFQAEKIIEELYSFITNSDINGLLDYWKYLYLRFFSRLDARHFGNVKKFEVSLLRYYLVYATQQKRKEKVFEFFDTFGTDLNENPEWSKWFGLPFSKNPAADPYFETFFTKQWLEIFTLSLHNFLNTIFQNMPFPSLLCFNLDRFQRCALEKDIQSLHKVIVDLKSKLEHYDPETSNLRKTVSQSSLESLNRARSPRRAKSLLDHKNKDTLTHSQFDHNGIKSPETYSDGRSTTSISEYDVDDTQELPNEDINPFTITSQETYLEHVSGISFAKFSHGGDLIASCDVDNVVRMWNYTGASAPCKINNPNSNVMCIEWEAKSDKLLLIGTDEGLIKAYNKETKSIAHEFQVDKKFPRVNQICSSPVEALFVCSGAPRLDNGLNNTSGLLSTWNLKTMTIQDTFILDSSISKSGLPIVPTETIKFNHNGQMLVTGDKAGCLRIFDIRTLKPIMEWNMLNVIETSSKKGSGVICSSQFSYNENTVYVVDEAGSLTQWSIHKPGLILSQSYLNDFPTFPSTSQNLSPMATKSLPNRKRTPSVSSVRSTKSNKSTSSVPAVMVSGNYDSPSSSNGETNGEGINRVPMVAFSSDTEYVVCASGREGRQGAIYRTSTGSQAQILTPNTAFLTAVDWTSAVGNVILTGASDGTVSVIKMVGSGL